MGDVISMRGRRRTARQGELQNARSLRTGLRWGDMSAAQLASALKQKERGEWRDWADLAEYMTKSDEELSGLIATRINAVASLDYIVEPGKSRDPVARRQADRAAEFVRNVIAAIQTSVAAESDGDMLERDFTGLVKSLMGAIGGGLQTLEIIWHRDVGALVPKHFEWRHPRDHAFGDGFQLLYAPTGSLTGAEELWPNQWAKHVHMEHEGWPTRSGVLEILAWTWWFRRQVRKWWVAGIERNGEPWRHAKVDPNTTPAQRDAIRDALEAMASSQVFVGEETIELVAHGGPGGMSNGEMYSRFWEQSGADMAKGVLGFSDASMPGENGARAAVESRVALSFTPRQREAARSVYASIERDVITPLLWLNEAQFGGVKPPIPRIRPVFEDESAEISDRAVGAGVVRVDELREAEGLEPIGEDNGGSEFVTGAWQQQGAWQPGAWQPGQHSPPGGAAPTSPFSRTTPTNPASTSRSTTVRAAHSQATRRTSSGLTNPLGRALSAPLAGPTRSSIAPRQLRLKL